jgi:membrane-bound serine protease (ClpP class)
VLLLVAIFLAVFVLPSPWGVVAVGVAAVIDITEVAVGIWYSKRRRSAVGVESLVGKRGIAVDTLWPEGQVRVNGELWKARCAGGCDPGTAVVVRAVEGLTLEVEPA